MTNRSPRLVHTECKDAFYHEHKILLLQDDLEVWHCPDEKRVWVARWHESVLSPTLEDPYAVTSGYYEYLNLRSLRLEFGFRSNPKMIYK